jgi:NAD(P)-dependent dehydrogenase (short-subunit alcohol dehydrogenase family)
VPLDETTTAGEVMAGVDLSGRTAIVTGASTGIGLETAANLAAAGARVIAGVRNAEKGATTVASLADRVAGGTVEFGVIDLTSFASIRSFAEGFVAREEPLNLLINNAGVMNTPFEHTVEGYELQFGTNHLGHFLLTNLLVPALIAGAPARVVNLSSGGHRSSDILWDDPNFERHPYDKMTAYGQSKTANVLFSVELDRRLADRGVHANAVHPGRINTELARYGPGRLRAPDRPAEGVRPGATPAQDNRGRCGHVALGGDGAGAGRPGRLVPGGLPRRRGLAVRHRRRGCQASVGPLRGIRRRDVPDLSCLT